MYIITQIQETERECQKNWESKDNRRKGDAMYIEMIFPAENRASLCKQRVSI